MSANLNIDPRWEDTTPVGPRMFVRASPAPAVRAAASVLGTGVMAPAASGAGSPRTVPDIELAERAGLHRRDAKKLDRFSLLALAAARTALESSDLSMEERRECGVIASTSVAGWSITEPQLRGLHREGLGRISPYLASAWFPAAPQGQITIHLGLKGYSKSIAGDRTGAIQAAAMAAGRIHRGGTSHVLVGGVDAPVVPFVKAAYESAGGHADDLYEASAFVMLGPAGSTPVSLVQCAVAYHRPEQTVEGVLRGLILNTRPRLVRSTALKSDSGTGEVVVVFDATPSHAGDLQIVLESFTEALDLNEPDFVSMPRVLPGDGLGAGSALALHTAIGCLRDGNYTDAFVVSIDRRTLACVQLSRVVPGNTGKNGDHHGN